MVVVVVVVVVVVALNEFVSLGPFGTYKTKALDFDLEFQTIQMANRPL